MRVDGMAVRRDERAIGHGARLLYSEQSCLGAVDAACARIAPSNATVLLLGETGTGKEVVARLIHQRSGRGGRPFVPVNCAAIPEALLESELFGHVRGAFTGAAVARAGRIAAAEGGTLFLDEIAELPLAMQGKLLRVLQERVYEPIGGSRPVSADFRLIAATNKDLAAEVAQDRFRQDLYYRLLVCPIDLPPLRERTGDVLHLFEHFWRQRGEHRLLAPELGEVLERYPWPGNVRELENLVERLSVCAAGPRIELADLPATIRGPARPAPLALAPVLPIVPPEQEPGQTARLPIDLPGLLRRLEDEYIEAALAQSGGNRKLAADLLGLQRTTLVEKLRRRQGARP